MSFAISPRRQGARSSTIEFNDARDPAALWEEYGAGVQEGALAGSVEAAKTMLSKAWVYGGDFPEEEK